MALGSFEIVESLSPWGLLGLGILASAVSIYLFLKAVKVMSSLMCLGFFLLGVTVLVVRFLSS